MMRRAAIVAVVALILCACTPARGADVEIIPPGEKIKQDHPRLMLRPRGTSYAISLGQLEALPRDAEFQAMVDRLKGERAAAQAMVWLITGEETAARRGIERMRTYRAPSSPDAFDIYFGLREMGLAYDWLYNHPSFTKEIKAQVRGNVAPLVKAGIKRGDDHVFHNYVWMSNSGLAMWALAAAGDDPEADNLLALVRDRLHGRLFPAMEYLNGLPGDGMGYWYIYNVGACVWMLMSAQSAFETDIVGAIEARQDHWLSRQLESLIQGTMPNMRYIPWGDIQSGADGGVTHEIAGVADALTWALKSPHGAHFSRWLAAKRGLRRYHQIYGVLYFLYTRHLRTGSAEPPLAMFAGREHGGQAMMRSSWKDDATVVGLRCTDHYGPHCHFDQGSFVIYRNGLLAVDAGLYNRIYGHQQQTDAHNTMLIGGRPQRTVRGQWFKDLAEFKENLKNPRDGRRLENGDIPFFKHADEWTAVAGQFAQAYPPDTVKSCVRQLLYVRPGTVAIVDHLVAADGGTVPEVKWMLHVPAETATVRKGSVRVTNERSWLRCRDLLETDPVPAVEKSYIGEGVGF